MVSDQFTTIKGDGTLRASFNAFQTADTARLTGHQLRFYGLTLRVVAPGAAQRTALEKHGSTDSGTVINGKALNIEENSCVHISILTRPPFPGLKITWGLSPGRRSINTASKGCEYHNYNGTIRVKLGW